MNKQKKKKIALVSATILALVLVISATFAWLTYQNTVVNSFTGELITDDTVTVKELFDPKPWTPGGKITKQVSVLNTGSDPVFIRISYEEALRKLQADATGSPEVVTTAAGAPAPEKSEVVPTNADVYTAWEDVSAKVAGLPKDSGIVVKRKQEGDASTYAVYKELTKATESMPGTYQKMSAASFTSNGSEGAAEIITATELKVHYYKGFPTPEGSKWAANTSDKFIGNATKGKYPRADVLAGYGLTAVTAAVKPTADVIEFSLDGGVPKGVSSLDSQVFINYSADLTSTMENGKWYYNGGTKAEPGDGYFYYIGKLASGAESPMLLESLVLDDQATVSHSLMEYDLAILLEGIQDLDEALSSDSGWNLKKESAIYKKLAEFAATNPK